MTRDYPTSQIGMLRAAITEGEARNDPADAALLDRLRAYLAECESKLIKVTPVALEEAEVREGSGKFTPSAPELNDRYAKQIAFFEALLVQKVDPAEHDAIRAKVANLPSRRSLEIDRLKKLPYLVKEERDWSKQIAFFELLLSQKTKPELAKAIREDVGDDPKKRSDAIQTLKAFPDLAPVLEPGMYLVDGHILRLKKAKHGNKLYCDEFNTETCKYQDAWKMLKLVRPEHAMSYEQQAEYGRITEHCIDCGRRLTRKESIKRGKGPICADK